MLLNYLKLSLRLLIRNPFFTLINVLGLAVGFMIFFVLYQHSETHLNADRFHKDYTSVVRFGHIWKQSDDLVHWTGMPLATNQPEITKQVKEDFTEIRDVTRIFNQPNFTPEYIPGHGKEITLTHINARQQRVTFIEPYAALLPEEIF